MCHSAAPNHDYVPPARLLNGTGPPLTTPNGEANTVALVHDGDLRELRHWLRDRLDDADPSPEAADAVVIAVHEVAANALRHGRPPVRVTLWLTPTQILCDVTDRGPGTTDPLSGYTPPDPFRLPEHGAGLWMARRLCDEVTTARSSTGFTVRMAVSRGVPEPATREVTEDRTR